MKIRQNMLISSGAVIVIGAFISFLLLIKIQVFWQAVLIGFFYSLILVFSIQIVRKYVVLKLTVLPIAQQWLFRSLTYTITISFAYLIGLLFQTLLVTPNLQMQQILLNKLWNTVVEFISYPFNLEFSRFFPELQQPVIIIFFAILVFIGIVSLLGSYVELRWRENRSRQLRDRAELHNLKSQIEPHFLFNTLNTITSLIKDDPEKAEELIIQLSDILQYRSVNAKKDCVRLVDEIDFTKKFVNILTTRFDETLTVSWFENFDDKNFKVPGLILQPVIENCIRHAWNDKNKSLSITVSVIQVGSGIRMTVMDNGRGILPQILKKIPIPDHALANIQERLQVMYKKSNLLTVESEYGQGATVTLTIPENCYD